MLRDDTDRSWEIIGRTDPYYGVLTSERYRASSLDDDDRRQFFETGQAHVLDLLRRLEGGFGPLNRGRALDFGCGVGRLVLPLAGPAGFARVLGIDISSSMLAEAASNARRAGLENVDFALSDDALSKVTGTFDFIHSYIVLQHIPVERGVSIIGKLLERLSPGGVAALHVPIASRASSLRRAVGSLRKSLIPLNVAINVLKKRPWREPLMQMNLYDLNSLMERCFLAGLTRPTIELLDRDGNLDAFLWVRRPTHETATGLR